MPSNYSFDLCVPTTIKHGYAGTNHCFKSWVKERGLKWVTLIDYRTVINEPYAGLNLVSLGQLQSSQCQNFHDGLMRQSWKKVGPCKYFCNKYDRPPHHKWNKSVEFLTAFTHGSLKDFIYERLERVVVAGIRFYLKNAARSWSGMALDFRCCRFYKF